MVKTRGECGGDLGRISSGIFFAELSHRCALTRADRRLIDYDEEDLPLQLSATHRRFMLKPSKVYGLDPKARARINFFLGIKAEEPVAEVGLDHFVFSPI